MDKAFTKTAMAITGALIAISTFSLLAFALARNFVMMIAAGFLLLINSFFFAGTISKDKKEDLETVIE